MPAGIVFIRLMPVKTAIRQNMAIYCVRELVAEQLSAAERLSAADHWSLIKTNGTAQAPLFPHGFTTSDTLVDWNDRVDIGDTVDWGDLVNPGGSQIIRPVGNFITDCVVNSCAGYNLTSCPTNGSCSECVSGTTTKYKLDTCNSGYAKVNDTCVKAYASCEAAGYLTSEPANAHCVSTYDIYLTNGTKVTCYSSSNMTFT